MSLFKALHAFQPWSQKSLLYEVTTRCNLKCLHCYNVWKDDVAYPTDELPTTQSLRLIESAISQTRCRQFVFTGGEPLLRDDLESLVQCAAKLCSHITLITNGILLSSNRIESLIGAGVDLFELPLNSANPPTHNHLAGDIDCFQSVIRAAMEIRSRGANLVLVFVGTAINIDHWSSVLDLGMALGARMFLFNRYNAGGRYHRAPEKLMPSIEQVRSGLDIAEKYVEKYGITVGASIAIPPCLIDPKVFPNVGFGFCAAGTSRAYYTLDPMGNVRPCNHSPTLLGNLFTTPFRKILQSEQLAAFCKGRPDFCNGCCLEHDCAGGCKAAAEVCYGSLKTCEPFLELNKHYANRSLRIDEN